MSHGSNDSVLEVVKNKLLQTRAEADKAQAEVERLQRLLIEEREKQKLVGSLNLTNEPQQKLQYAEKEANEAKQELVFLRQKIAQEGAAREKAERELAVLKQILQDETSRKAQNDTLRNLYPRK
ncbi:hypothetical protein Mgra_00004386 [Meloidogyne graminicola]|uniref:Uncharacterized protein n=1 Tax=Meloidogyne graminicola TaxID=189291 RepID=A0A8S9ZSD3_9BILA|nr:hypothetical protein Mgra_00004386 [Meloidogyne graminicola]